MPSWIKGWMNFLSSPGVVSGNVVLFLVMLHQSCSEEMLWLTCSSSLGSWTRNIPAKCLATESLLPSTNNWLLARWETAGGGKHFMNHHSHAFAYPRISSQNTSTLIHTRSHLYSRIFSICPAGCYAKGRWENPELLWKDRELTWSSKCVCLHPQAPVLPYSCCHCHHQQGWQQQEDGFTSPSAAGISCSWKITCLNF